MEDRQDLEEIQDLRELDDADELYVTQPRIYRKRVDPFVMYTEKEFLRRYRFSKQETHRIIDLVKNDLKKNINEKGKPIAPELKVLAALSGFARNRAQEDTGDIHGFSQPTMSRINVEVAEALAQKIDAYIKFPTSLEDQATAMQGFKNIAGMEGVIGAIDCTHVRVKKTGGVLAQMYVNRKGFYSLNVQVGR